MPLRHRIVTVRPSRTTSGQAFQREPKALCKTILLKCLEPVRRARRDKTTTTRKMRRYGELIKPDQGNSYTTGDTLRLRSDSLAFCIYIRIASFAHATIQSLPSSGHSMYDAPYRRMMRRPHCAGLKILRRNQEKGRPPLGKRPSYASSPDCATRRSPGVFRL